MGALDLFSPKARAAARETASNRLERARAEWWAMFHEVATLDGYSLKVPSVEAAMKLPAFAGAVQLLANELSMLPVVTYKRGEDEDRTRVFDIEARRLEMLWTDQEVAVSAIRRFFLNVFKHGRGYAIIVRSGSTRNQVTGLHVIDPRRVERHFMDGEVVYWVSDLKPGTGEYLRGDVVEVFWHPRANAYPFGPYEHERPWRSPVREGWQAIRGGLMAMIFAGDFFANGSIPLAVFETPQGGQKALQRAADDLEAAIKHMRRRGMRLMSVAQGTVIHKLGVDPENAQLAELRRMATEEVARLFGVPPSAIQEMERATYSNVEQADIHLAKHSVAPWATLFQQELSARCFGLNSQRFVLMDLRGLQRGTFKERTEGVGRLVERGVMKRNEGRREFGLPDVEGGDEFLVGSGMGPLQEAGKAMDDALGQIQNGTGNGQDPDPDEAARALRALANRLGNGSQ